MVTRVAPAAFNASAADCALSPETPGVVDDEDMLTGDLWVVLVWQDEPIQLRDG